MAKLALDQAPPPNLPRRFLLTSPLWGVVAGALLLVDGDTAVFSRWAPATLALVHAFTLGVLGNAMFGSLLQFLPAAAGVRVRGGMAAGRCLHVLLNVGAMALLVGFRASHPHSLIVAGACLVSAFVLLAAMTLLVAQAQRLLRLGIAVAAVAGVVTALIGAAMLLSLTAAGSGLALQPWANVHAAWGAVGWALVLVASVAQVVMPMFQGTAGAVLARRPARTAGGLGRVGLRWPGAAGRRARDRDRPAAAAGRHAAGDRRLLGLDRTTPGHGPGRAPAQRASGCCPTPTSPACSPCSWVRAPPCWPRCCGPRSLDWQAWRWSRRTAGSAWPCTAWADAAIDSWYHGRQPHEPQIYSCSGCSSAAQTANQLAIWLDRDGAAEMSCIAGVGGDVTGLVRTAQSGRAC